jgi:alpha-glucosidase
VENLSKHNGLSRSDQDFSKNLKFIKAGKPLLITEQYTALHGKRARCSNTANEIVVSFENPGKAKWL